MGSQLRPEPPRSLPDPLRRLLDAADGAEQERAWPEFLESYSRLILYVARQMSRDHDTVMDRYAFVLERLREQSCRRLRTFAADGRGKFTTWLTVVVRRLCLDHDRRTRGRKPSATSPDAPRRPVELVLDSVALDMFPDARPSADEVLEREQARQRVVAAVARLSSSDQLLLSLRYRDNRSAREIASLMSLPTPFHVYRRLSRLHDALRQVLATPADRERHAPAQSLAPLPFNSGGVGDSPSRRHDASFS